MMCANIMIARIMSTRPFMGTITFLISLRSRRGSRKATSVYSPGATCCGLLIMLTITTAHCLHHLLSSAKCQADMTPVLLHWTVDDHVPVLKWDGVKRSCVDWDSLMTWGNEHSMTHSETMPSVSSEQHSSFITSRLYT